MTLVTRPYYRSSYVSVTRPGTKPIASFDDPSLRHLKVGVQLVGDDGQNTPPAHALAARHIIGNVVGYTLYGDYLRPNPPAGGRRPKKVGDDPGVRGCGMRLVGPLDADPAPRPIGKGRR